MFTYKKINQKDYYIAIVLIILVLSIRLLSSAGENVLYSYDSGNIVLATKNYNISEERPHLPGYFLYVQVIRLVNNLTGNSQKSIIILITLFSALGSGLLYILLRQLYDMRLSLLVSGLIMTNPLIWFFGSVAEIYSFDFFFALIFVLTGKSNKFIFWLPILLALGTGIRATSGLILFSLYIWFWLRYLKETKNYKLFFISNVLGLIMLLLWLVPMLNTVGGTASFLELMRSQNPVPIISIIKNILQLFTMGFWFIVPLSFLTIMNKIKREKLNFAIDSKAIIYILLIPALFVFVFVHYTRGYLLITVPALALLLASVSKKKFAQIFIVIWLVLQTVYFLFMPFKFERADIFYTPSQRTISQSEVLLDRFLSQNALTLAHIRKMDEMYRNIEKIVKRNKKYKYILLDPTVLLKARALQATIQGVSFAELNTVRPDGYFLYADMKQYNLAGRRQLLDSALIVGLKYFVESVPSSIIDVVKKANYFDFYTCRENKEYELKQIYTKYFQKR